MIISRVEKESEHKGNQVILVRGSQIEIAIELLNVMKEILKRGFDEDLLLSTTIGAIEEKHKK